MDSDDHMSEVVLTSSEINDRSGNPLSGRGTLGHRWDGVDEELETALMRMRDDLFPLRLG